jgi:hypothetical protein
MTDTSRLTMKRGIIGTFHNVSRKYLPLYVAEFEWRYNDLRESPTVFQRPPDPRGCLR